MTVTLKVKLTIRLIVSWNMTQWTRKVLKIWLGVPSKWKNLKVKTVTELCLLPPPKYDIPYLRAKVRPFFVWFSYNQGFTFKNITLTF